MLGQIRVLLADDMPELRTLLRTNLEFDGRFDIIGEAANGLEAVALVASEHPDVVILDLAMPEMDGLAAISQIKQVAPGTKILVLSAFAQDYNREAAISLGAEGFLEKDRPMDDIISELIDICDVPTPE